MTAEIVSLSGMDGDDEGYQAFLKDLNDGVSNVIFLVEKSNGTVRVGCNYEDRRDLVMALYRLQNIAQSILNHEGN